MVSERKSLTTKLRTLKSGLLIRVVSEKIQTEAKEQKGGFLSMVLGALGASLLGNLLAAKGAMATREGRGTIRAGEGTSRADQDF